MLSIFGRERNYVLGLTKEQTQGVKMQSGTDWLPACSSEIPDGQHSVASKMRTQRDRHSDEVQFEG